MLHLSFAAYPNSISIYVYRMFLVKLAYNLAEAYKLGAEIIIGLSWKIFFHVILNPTYVFLSVVKFCFYGHIYLPDFMTLLLSIFL